MPNKTQEYLNLAQQTAKELTRYWENWTDYLTTASRLYKYSFADQLMIYAQRPDATACASFDIWNNRIEEMQERVDAATSRYHELGDSIKASENRLAEIAVLKAHIINYAKTRPIYDAYRKTGYSKRFLEAHHTEITLHKAAKAAFDESNLKTLPKVKELDAEYSKLLTEKKALYPDYRKAKEEMQELLRARRNVELFFAEEKDGTEKTKSR